MLKWFATYFGFSRRELNGVTVLALILLLIWGVTQIISRQSREIDSDIADRIVEIDDFLKTAKESKGSVDRYTYGYDDQNEVSEREVACFMFDPNGLPASDWKRLGLSDRQIQMIKNYEAKGGRFRTKEDLARIYAIDEADYARLEPYIKIKQANSTQPSDKQASQYSAAGPDTSPTLSGQFVRRTESTNLYIDLNDADSLELQYLPGIGPVFASRIVRFRELLGGFHHVTQLLDVYGFDSVRFAALEKLVYVDTTKVQKIPLNTADYQRFRDHPFISHKLANAIVQYRKQHGPYRSVGDLLRIAIMEDQIFCKIAPYLTLVDD